MAVDVVVTVLYPSVHDVNIEIVNIETGKTIKEHRLPEGAYAKFSLNDKQTVHLSEVPKQ